MRNTQFARYLPVSRSRPTGDAWLDPFSAGFVQEEFSLDEAITEWTEYRVPAEMGYSPEFVSQLFYNTVDLWWIICRFNGIIDVHSEFLPGTLIRVPDQSQVLAYLARLPVTREDQDDLSGIDAPPGTLVTIT